MCQARGMRIYGRQTGGEIPPAHGYHYEREGQYGIFLGLVLFWMVAPPLQPGAVGSYLVWGAWFPSHLLLEGTGHIQIFGS
jgi:hypothetical protein